MKPEERIITFPTMGRKNTDSIKNHLESLDMKVILPPPTSDDTIKIGVKNSADMMCFPYKVTLGNYVEAIEKGANTLLIFDSAGRCRFREYGKLHKNALKELGYKERFENGEIEMYDMTITQIVPKLAKLSGKSLGEAYGAFKNYLKDTNEEDNTFKTWSKDKPNIGIIGEIFCACDEKINFNLEERIRDFGGNPYNTARVGDFVHDMILKKLNLYDNKVWDFITRNPMREYKKQAKAFFNSGNGVGGHSLENLYNLLSLRDRGVDGIIQIQPLSCMPESTIEPYVDQICRDGGIPKLRLHIDENNSEQNFKTRVETFVKMIKLKKEGPITELKNESFPEITSNGKKPAYIGVDCGSVGIKLALIGEDKQVINSVYLRNKGIIDTLHKGLEKIARDDYEIVGVGTTGSGRQFSSHLVGADVVETEILAHAVGALNFYPDVKTILDIGGEDCKIIKVRDGVTEDFVMNSVCGAGTGSVIDTISNRMGIQVEEFGDLALDHKNYLGFPGKCGVFTQSAVVSRLNSGKEKSDIAMGVTRGLVNNYLMLGRGIKLEPPYVYQGATSQNKAIVKALEEQLGSEVIVPEHSPIMGAIGIALLAQKSRNGKTNFKGYNFTDKNYRTKDLNAKGCEKRCEINLVYDGKIYIGAVGNGCDNCVPNKK